MTNEEAIRALEHIRSAIRNGIPPTKPGKAIEAVDLAISALSRDRWISVEERLPEPWVDVLTYFTFGREMQVDNTDDFGRFSTFKTTHWRPLPEPPKEDKP